MLHRKSEEIDKEGNVIGGELKKKCDSFIACLEEFEHQYLSDKFNPSTVSGKAQQGMLNSFKKWLDRTNQQYSAERRQGDNYLAELRQYREQIKFCFDQAARR